MITQQLGISEDQAKGGAGALFRLAQKTLGTADFGKVSEAIPQAQELIDTAPKAGALGNVLGSLTSSTGGSGSGTAGLATLSSQFAKIDLDTDAIAKFVPVILSFAQAKGGEGLKNILGSVLK